MNTLETLRAGLQDLLDKRAHLFKVEAQPLLDVSTTRALNKDELAKEAEVDAAFERFDRAITQTRAQIENAEARAQMGLGDNAGAQTATRGSLVRVNDRQPAAVERAQAFTSHPALQAEAGNYGQRDAATIAQYGDVAQMIRALSTTGANAIVPTVWAGNVIDLARNKSAVIQAGAQVIPMDAKTVQIGRLTGDPTAAFRAEGDAITASDPTFDNVTLTAKTMSALVVANMEWLQDSDNGAPLVQNAIAEAIAAKLDLVSLYGGITAGAGALSLATPPNPRGILATLNALAAGNVLGGAVNGTTQTAGHIWDEILDALFTPADSNETSTAVLWNSKLARLYAKAVDTTGQPLAMPPALADVDRFVTNQIPSYTQGTMANVATDVFAGDFAQVLIGQRLGLTLQVLNERYADNGQVGIVATWRGDIGIARPKGLAVYKAIKGA